MARWQHGPGHAAFYSHGLNSRISYNVSIVNFTENLKTKLFTSLKHSRNLWKKIKIVHLYMYTYKCNSNAWWGGGYPVEFEATYPTSCRPTLTSRTENKGQGQHPWMRLKRMINRCYADWPQRSHTRWILQHPITQCEKNSEKTYLVILTARNRSTDVRWVMVELAGVVIGAVVEAVADCLVITASGTAHLFW